MKTKDIKKRYNKLLHDVKTKQFYKLDLTNRVNCYVCKHCGHITKTKDIDAGVTSMFFMCENCGANATSTFYKNIAPNQQPTQEWFRPTLEQVLKMDDEMQEHILKGGLAVRKIST
jgi:transcription elongation factor Elf1